jgi:hypothetical protein
MRQTVSSAVMREITPLSPGDCFAVFTRERKCLDCPLHYHDEYEITLISNARVLKELWAIV